MRRRPKSGDAVRQRNSLRRNIILRRLIFFREILLSLYDDISLCGIVSSAIAYIYLISEFFLKK